MRTMKQLKNLLLFSREALTTPGAGLLEKVVAMMAGLLCCTSYRYCMEECLHDLNITGIMKDFAQRIQNHLVSS